MTPRNSMLSLYHSPSWHESTGLSTSAPSTLCLSCGRMRSRSHLSRYMLWLTQRRNNKHFALANKVQTHLSSFVRSRRVGQPAVTEPERAKIQNQKPLTTTQTPTIISNSGVIWNKYSSSLPNWQWSRSKSSLQTWKNPVSKKISRRYNHGNLREITPTQFQLKLTEIRP